IHDTRQTLNRTENVTELVDNLWSAACDRELPGNLHKEIAERVSLGSEGMPSVEGDLDARPDRLGEFKVDQERSSSSESRQRTHLVLEAVSGLLSTDLAERERVNGAFLLAADLAADDPDAA